MRVVIADDSMLMRQGLARLLSDAGCDVVATAERAMEVPWTLRMPDVIESFPKESCSAERWLTYFVNFPKQSVEATELSTSGWWTRMCCSWLWTGMARDFVQVQPHGPQLWQEPADVPEARAGDVPRV